MNILFIIKVNILMLLKWSSTMFTIVPRMVIVFEACNPISYHHCDNTLKPRSKCNRSFWALRTTSHMRLKAHDHCILRSRIGRKGRDHASLLHSRKQRSKNPKKNLHGFLHDKVYLIFHGVLGFASNSPSQIKYDANSSRPCHSNN